MTHSVASWGKIWALSRQNKLWNCSDSQYQELSPFIREVDILVLILLSSYSGDWHEAGVEYIVGGVAV